MVFFHLNESLSPVLVHGPGKYSAHPSGLKEVATATVIYLMLIFVN